MAYSMIIDPNKWVNIKDVKIEPDTPYWAKMTDGRIVMTAWHSNGYSSGMAVCYVGNNGIIAKGDHFYILRNCMIQPIQLL